MPQDFIQILLEQASLQWEFKLLVTLAVLVVTLLVRWLLLRIISRNIADPTVRLVWRQIVNATIMLVLVLALMWTWLEGIGAALTLLTLVAAAMTIVHKELIQNVTSWSVIAWRGLFALGDHIEVGPHTGKVTDVGPMYFTLSEATGIDTGLRPTGRTIRVPNAQVLTHPVVNYSDQGLRWIDLEFAVAGDSDWELALRIVQEIIEMESKSTPIDPSKPTDRTVTVQVVGGNVVLTAHYPTEPAQRILSQTRVTRRVLKRFAESNLKLV